MDFEPKKLRTPQKLRHVGFEIECLVNLPKNYHGYDDVYEISYGRANRYIESVHDDGSIYESDNRPGHPVEFVTNPLLASRERAIKAICKVVTARNGYVNASCGGHIHVDARDLKRDVDNNPQEAGEFLSLFEPALYAVTGKKRLSNSFCRPLHFDSFGTFCGYDDRYYAINFQSVEKYGSLEFRCFAGTLRPERWLARAALAEGIVNNLKKFLNDKTTFNKALKFSPAYAYRAGINPKHLLRNKESWYKEAIATNGEEIIKQACKFNKVSKRHIAQLLADHRDLWRPAPLSE